MRTRQSKLKGFRQRTGTWGQECICGKCSRAKPFCKGHSPKAKLLLCFTFLCSFSSQEGLPRKEIALPEPAEVTYWGNTGKKRNTSEVVISGQPEDTEARRQALDTP